MLGNSLRSLVLSQKCLLYRTCVLLITLYNFLLQYYNKASLTYLLEKLRKMQYKATVWILRAFHTSISLDIKAITGLILIYLYLQKLGGRFQLRTQLLPFNHVVKVESSELYLFLFPFFILILILIYFSFFYFQNLGLGLK